MPNYNFAATGDFMINGEDARMKKDVQREFHVHLIVQSFNGQTDFYCVISGEIIRKTRNNQTDRT